MAEQRLHRHEVNISIKEITSDRAPDVMRRQVRHVGLDGTLHDHITYRRRAKRCTMNAATPVDWQNEAMRR